MTTIGTVETGALTVYHRQHDHPNSMLSVVAAILRLEPKTTTVKQYTDLRLPAIAWDNGQKLVHIDLPFNWFLSLYVLIVLRDDY